LAARVRFFLDENVPIVIAEQLRQRGIGVFTVRDLDLLGEGDAALLKRAADMGCVFCTHDADYVDGGSRYRARRTRVRIAAPPYHRGLD
jgi:predicted nuclease of predicted toxin-antitoxin system